MNSRVSVGRAEEEEPGALAALGALALVAFLIFAIFRSMANPAGERLYTIKQADILLSAGRYSEAAKLLESALTRYDTPQVRLYLSYAYLARRDAERAERQAQLVIAAAPGDLKPAAWTQLGRSLALAGRSNDAQNAWATAITSAVPFRGVAPIEAQVRSATWHVAQSQWSRFDYGAARASLESLLNTEDIYSVSARLELAQLFAPTDSDLSRKHLQTAERQLQDMSLDAAIPDLRVPGVQEGLAPYIITTTVAGLKNAFTDADKAHKEGASTAGMAALWGRAFLQQGEPYLAKTYLEKAVTLQPELADAHSFLGLALSSIGNVLGATNHLKTATNLAPQRPLPHYALARLHMQSGDWDNASKELSAIKKLEPDSVQFHVLLGEYYSQRGAYDAAEDEYLAAMGKQALAASAPANLDAALALSRFYTELRGYGCERGLPAARISLERNPGDPSAYDAVGWSLVLCNKATEALSALEHATKAAPDNPRFRFHLGKAYALLNRQADARAEFTRVMDLDPEGVWESQAVAAIVRLNQ